MNGSVTVLCSRTNALRLQMLPEFDTVTFPVVDSNRCFARIDLRLKQFLHHYSGSHQLISSEPIEVEGFWYIQREGYRTMFARNATKDSDTILKVLVCMRLSKFFLHSEHFKQAWACNFGTNRYWSSIPIKFMETLKYYYLSRWLVGISQTRLTRRNSLQFQAWR